MGKSLKAIVDLPPHVNCVRTRYGEYFYFHPGRGTPNAGKAMRLPGCPVNPDGSLNTEWWDAYRALARTPLQAPKAGTFTALIARYKLAPAWLDLSPNTRREWTRHLAYIESRWGALPVAALAPVGVRTLIDSRQDTPADANNLLRCVRSVLSWSVERGWSTQNAAREIRSFSAGDPYVPWSWDMIEFFRENVSRRDLWHAVAFALYTGQRKGDVLAMRMAHLQGDDLGLKLHVRQAKTGKSLRIHLHRELKALLPELEERRRAFMKVQALDPAQVPVLVTSRGTAWTSGGFNTTWIQELDRPQMAVLRERRLVFHGLRKSAVVMMLEAGATEHEVMAVTGQSPKMVAHYAQQVNNEKLSARAILKWQAAGVESNSIR